MKRHVCPSCEGKKYVCGFVLDARTGRHRISADAPCRQCNGEGFVTDEQLDWIRLGRNLRQARIRQKESASTAALRLGLSVSQLTDAEMGRISPSILEEVDSTMVVDA